MNETREHDLREVFHIDSPTKLDAQIARVSVLFEDLRIEIMEMSRTTEPKFDPAGHRVNYFLRRSLATLNEFGDALTALDRNDRFKAVKDRFDEDGKRTWSDALDHLETLVGKKGKKRIITAIRDDIGGHFGEEAASKSLQYAQQRGAGKGSLEIFTKEDGLAARGRSPKSSKNGLQTIGSTSRFGGKTTSTTGC
jgi:hypothetical protein